MQDGSRRKQLTRLAQKIKAVALISLPIYSSTAQSAQAAPPLQPIEDFLHLATLQPQFNKEGIPIHTKINAMSALQLQALDSPEFESLISSKGNDNLTRLYVSTKSHIALAKIEAKSFFVPSVAQQYSPDLERAIRTYTDAQRDTSKLSRELEAVFKVSVRRHP
ncbi:MAG: hypothetical protein LBJ77_03955 [Holosporales bacterium]|jgi:hypothetical protein|nr:hypothetical protein [Holosporales bacterium]